MGSTNVIVIGAGVVGVCCALWLQKNGHKVILIDRGDPGAGTSSGNACTIADYACIPINNPKLFRQLPSLLFARQSPLSFDPLYVISHLGWISKFLRNCSRSRVAYIIEALGTLLQHTAAGLDPLISETNSAQLFNDQGCLYVYQTKKAHEAAYPYNLSRLDHGVQFDWLKSDGIKDLEPGLNLNFYSGMLFREARQVINPQILVTRFFDHFVANGGEFIRTSVKGLDASGQAAVMVNGNTVPADKVIVAAGAFSKQIENTGTARLPLDTERGYHVQFEGKQTLLQRPVGWAEAGLYATPTNEGLRLAGTVEIAGLEKPANQRSLDYLTQKANEMFNLEEKPQQTWLGYRPTLPDALPVIGQSVQSPHVYYAFGHQHIGLTLAGITGKLISELVAGQAPSVDISPFSPERFS